MKRWMRMGLTATIATTVVTGLAGGAADVSARGKMETYVSPTYGVTMEYDAATWSVFQENDGSDGDNVDFLGLESDEIRGGFMIQIYDTQSDPEDCLVDLVELGLEDGEDPELREDEDGEPMEGSSRGYAYSAYNVLRDGTYVANYFGCQEFGDDLGMIAFWLMVNSRDFDAGLALIEPIIESVDDSDAHAAGESDDDRDRDEDDDNDRDRDEDDDGSDKDEDDRDRDEDDEDGSEFADAGVYESEEFGFTVPYNAETWTFEQVTVDGNMESAEFIGPRNESLDILALPADGAPLHEYVEYYAESLGRQGDLDIEVYEDPDTGDTLERRSRNEVYTLYTFESDGTDFLLYLHAVTADNGRYVVMVVGLATADSFDVLEEDVFPLLDQIEF